MKKLIFLIFLILPCVLYAIPKYDLGEWQEKGHGNHRALVHVTDTSDYNYAKIEWRRRDENPQTKGIVIENSNGEEIEDYYVQNINRIYGEIVFKPNITGDYYIYYLPYNPGVGNFDSAGTYFSPKEKKDLGLDINSLPKAELVQIEARKHKEVLRPDFNSMYPMEVIATKEETENLIKANKGDFLLFPEDRQHHIKMTKDLPYRWIEKGPSDSFEGDTRPNEYYVFQIGLYAIKDIENIKIKFSDLKGENGVISDITCFNLGGIDWKGDAFTKNVSVKKGLVQALWIGVSVPSEAKGTFTGKWEISADNTEPVPFSVNLNVSGEILEDRGDSDIFSLSRLRWLNDTTGIEDTVPTGWTDLVYDTNKVDIIGRSFHFGEKGFFDSMVSRENEILANPIEFVVKSNKDYKNKLISQDWVKKDKAAGVFVSNLENETFSEEIKCKVEFDGAVNCSIKLKAKKDFNAKDILLNIPVRKEIAKYAMGMGLQGGYTPYSYNWEWNPVRADHEIWMGDVNAGFQLMLRHPFDTWQTLDMLDTGCPESWYNGGKGGVRFTQKDNVVLLQAYTGDRNLSKDQETEFNFRLLVTPFRYDNNKHWNYRDGWNGSVGGGNNFLQFHGQAPTEYINYPFMHEKELKEVFDSVKSQKVYKSYSENAKGKINPKHGTVHILATLDFDPEKVHSNQPLFALEYKDRSTFDAYWCIDTKGLRSHVQIGPWQNNVYPYIDNAPAYEWKKGTKVLISYTWGDYLAIYYDGVLRSQKVDFKGTHNLDLDTAVLNIGGPWNIEKVKITDTQYDGGEVDWTQDEHTLFYDENHEGPIHNPVSVSQYYTVRELSNMLPELYALKSLGDEIYYNGNYLVYTDKESVINQFGGGYPWLLEHLDNDYVPAWRQPLGNGETDAAISTSGLSRWHNYYVKGLDYLMKNVGLEGLYIDGIGFDREVMKRIIRVMEKNNPNYRINFHAFNCYDYLGMQMSPSNQYMEHVAFASNLWNGEAYNYDMPPEYWLCEISGIPYGNTAEMLEYTYGGNQYRGMVYGMTGRLLQNVKDMWKFWDEFGIQDAKWIGYWDKNCPVTTNDNNILASVYVKDDKILIAMGSWSDENKSIKLNIDWDKLGISPKSHAYAPFINGFQDKEEIDINNILIEKDKGKLVIISD